MFWIFIIVLLAFVIIFAIIFSSNRLYCYFFEHKEYKLWKKYIKDIDKFKYDGGYSNCYRFTIPNTDISAYVWFYEGCSIHDGTKCVCCSFDKYHSDKMKKLLMDKIKK